MDWRCPWPLGSAKGGQVLAESGPHQYDPSGYDWCGRFIFVVYFFWIVNETARGHGFGRLNSVSFLERVPDVFFRKTPLKKFFEDFDIDELMEMILNRVLPAGLGMEDARVAAFSKLILH